MQEFHRHIEREQIVGRCGTGPVLVVCHRLVKFQAKPLVPVQQHGANRARTTSVCRVVRQAIEHILGELSLLLGRRNRGQTQQKDGYCYDFPESALHVVCVICAYPYKMRVNTQNAPLRRRSLQPFEYAKVTINLCKTMFFGKKFRPPITNILKIRILHKPLDFDCLPIVVYGWFCPCRLPRVL